MANPYASIEHLAHLAIEEQGKVRPEVFASYGGKVEKCVRDTKYHITFLFDAVSIDSPKIFLNYVAWAKVVLKHIGVTPEMFRENLEQIQVVCRSEMEGDFTKKVDETLQQALESYPEMPEHIPTFLDVDDDHGKIASKYLEQVLKGDRRGAQQAIFQAMAEGMELKALYLSILQPTQYELGRRWQHGLISVAQEHYATAVTQQTMSLIYPSIIYDGGRKGVLVITCVSNELHEMGARMVADLLELDGWDSIYLGSNTPTPAVISMLKQRRAKGLFISATMGHNVNQVLYLVEEIRRDPELAGLKIVVGGYPFNEVEGLWKEVGADGYAKDAEFAVSVANDLIRGHP